MPSPAEIATDDAQRLALVLSEVGGEGAPIGGGWMACDVPGSWADYAAGLGLKGEVAEETFEELVAFYRTRDRQPRIQLTACEHPTLLRGLEARGFTPYRGGAVLARMLDALPEQNLIEGMTFRRIDPANEEDVQEFCTSQMIGFFDEEDHPKGMVPITERVARSQRSRLWLVEIDGTVVGSGGFESHEDSGQLVAGCVHPEARRQGVHSAFIRFRLAQAAKAGLRYLTIGSEPGGPTERNARRAGFSMAYMQTSYCR